MRKRRLQNRSPQNSPQSVPTAFSIAGRSFLQEVFSSELSPDGFTLDHFSACALLKVEKGAALSQAEVLSARGDFTYRPHGREREQLLFRAILDLTKVRSDKLKRNRYELIRSDPTIPKLWVDKAYAVYGDSRFGVRVPRTTRFRVDFKGSILGRHPRTSVLFQNLSPYEQKRCGEAVRIPLRPPGRRGQGSKQLTIFVLLHHLRPTSERAGRQTRLQVACRRAARLIRQKGYPSQPNRTRRSRGANDLPPLSADDKATTWKQVHGLYKRARSALAPLVLESSSALQSYQRRVLSFYGFSTGGPEPKS